MKKLLVLAIVWVSAGAAFAEVFDVRQFGAAGDGKTKDTPAIQRAIDAASDAGGGTVYLPPGTYLSGTLFLKDNVSIHIEAGATLLGSTDGQDFPCIDPAFRSYVENYACQALIYGEKLHDIAVLGRGVIDGQGDAKGYWADQNDWKLRKRPFLVRFAECKNVRVEGVAFRRSPMWVQHYLACENVVIDGIDVFSHVQTNNDMINIDCCKNVHIANCTGDTDDDAIVLKATGGKVCENVVVTNCVLRTHSNAIKCGTESNGGFRNIAVSNCAIFPSRVEKDFWGPKDGWGGIALEMVDGGTLEGITVSNIAIEATMSPIFMRLGNRARPYVKDQPKPGMGSFRNVIISNVVATRASKVGCSITGIPGHPIENLTLSNIKITYEGGGTAEDAARVVPEVPEAYPNPDMFGTLPAYGFFIRHVDGLILDNVDLRFAKPDARPAMICEGVKNLNINNFAGRPSDKAPVMVFQDVQTALLRGCIAPYGTGVWLRLAGRTDRIAVLANDLSSTRKAFDLADGLDPAVLFEQANRLPK